MNISIDKKEEKNIDKIETKNNSKDNEIPIIIEEKQNEIRKKYKRYQKEVDENVGKKI